MQAAVCKTLYAGKLVKSPYSLLYRSPGDNYRFI
jgi:hypothetical protein